ncbi:MAG: glutamate-5-semialdehyde dehydrogenase [Spirulinaceae cyanobacterium RM2_2_10]|nr:glutamate-5-semialdehyde dehydrogenase [Spirulinaceae cyanobacterium SM2_1_0]NJO20292.1 glutamate-5-semialdehyde dehydrogenase [Spirulinaceae cyanobacterium RM2_2_10]
MVASDFATIPLAEMAQQTRQAARQLAGLSGDTRDRALEAIAAALESLSPTILAANAADCDAAIADGISPALHARLKLSETKLAATIAGVRSLRQLPDPLGQVQIDRELAPDLLLKRVTCPLGVLAVVFEARPEALIQIASLAIKSGNGVILKGGKEAVRSCQMLTAAVHRGLAAMGLPTAAVQLLTTRAETQALLALENDIDLIVPRGSNDFVRYVQRHTNIPVLGHADGICHLYVDASADVDMAVRLTVDAKTQYPAACNAIETLLVHAQIAPDFLPAVARALTDAGVQLRGDSQTCGLIAALPAEASDWSLEYSDLILAIKVVDSAEAAIAHIHTYGSRHTEAIATTDAQVAAQFLNQVDAASVFHNCSTRFADGFRYGFGAEVGISTQKLPPRGPVGLEGLVTYQYQVTGRGQIVADYTGENAQPFTHRDR